ncbi:MAG: ketopantoate reductase family protein [Candidatus Omnitrophota bacterium]|jgi:2-dehydropantoate 2-reductase|nr:MAG: ketopantoate reductase family protein [Candidatus Omnitrophota bacterium]
MKIAVVGSGAIGGLVAGYLSLKGKDVVLIGRSNSVAAINSKGLFISGVRGDFKVNIPVKDKLVSDVDLAIFCTKSQDLEQSISQNIDFIKQAQILTTQNGIRSEGIALKYADKASIISSIVMFGSTNLEPGRIVHNFEGNWILGRPFIENDRTLIDVSLVLNEIFPTVISHNIRAMKFLKIFVNANNCIPAILGLSMQEAFSDTDTSRISVAIWREGFDIVKRSGINLVSLPDFPLERLTGIISMPMESAAKVISGIMSGLSKEPLYGSILQSIKRGKDTEIDYINGEFVKLAAENKLAAPLNKRLVEMVHIVEKNGKFFSREQLIEETKGLLA